jgi:predicted permease
MIPLVLFLLYIFYKKVFLKFDREEKGIIVFGLMFFVVNLLPFLGLGNITSRYSYFASMGIVLILVLLIKKLYRYLLSNGKEIAIPIVALFIIVYSLFQIIQVQQSYFNWSGAGEKVRTFFISMDASYSNFWSQGPVEFHFVNVPIKVGDAWVFPVGLNDAVWFAFKNPQTKIVINSDTQTALQQIGNSLTKRAFVFNDDGSVTELIRKFPLY